MENLENIIESILFVNGDAVDINDIVSKIDVTKAEIKTAVKNLQKKLALLSQGRLIIKKHNFLKPNKVRLSLPTYHKQKEIFLN